MLDYHDATNDRVGSVRRDRIVRLSKKFGEAPEDAPDITLIHLDTGEVLETLDSIRTVSARLNSDD